MEGVNLINVSHSYRVIVGDLLTFVGFVTLRTCVTKPELLAGTRVALGGRSCNWNV